MLLLKYITYKNDKNILSIETSSIFEYPTIHKTPQHVNLIANLRNKGITSSQIISMGIAEVKADYFKVIHEYSVQEQNEYLLHTEGMLNLLNVNILNNGKVR